MRMHLCITCTLLCICNHIFAQQSDSIQDRINNFPARFFSHVQTESTDLDKDLTRQTEKYLQKLSTDDAKLKKKLYKLDSTSAARLYSTNPEATYTNLLQKLRNDSATIMRSMGSEYLPYLDSLQGTLAFLNKNPQLLNTSKILPANIQGSLSQLQQVETKLQDADQIKQFIQNRKAQIAQYLNQYSHLPSSITGIYQNYNKELYYYSDQVRQYREMLNDPDKMTQKALSLLNQLPAFTSFMKKNSFLAGLLSVPGDYGESTALDGLQTRQQVLSMIQSKVGQGGSSASSMISQSLQAAHQDITKLQNKLSALGAGSGDMDMPDFKPNNQKTKTFLKRIEYGVNIQTVQASNWYPTTTSIGLSLGYKIDDKNTIGIGASYNFGWGTGIDHISFSNQGIGLRSFADLQVKKTWYASGGYELNYQQPFASLTHLPNLVYWQQSGLVGVTKMVSFTGKLIKKTKVQLLWNFLSYYQVPATSPLLFRVGYNF
jgi:hypothetical protein